MRITRVVVFGYGNASRGDDGVGPLLLARLAALAPPVGVSVTCIEDFQLQIEHALDLDEADLALFIDAGTGTPPPFAFWEGQPAPSVSPCSHALTPAAVLAVFQQMRHRPPPPAFVLCVRGDDFRLGAPLSEAGEQHCEQAWAFLQQLIKACDPAAWRGLVRGMTLVQ